MALHGEVNYWAVLLCAAVAMGISPLWYSSFLFGKMWMDTIDKTEEEIKKDFNPIKTYGLAFLGQLVMAYTLARIMSYLGADTVAQGIRLAFLCWIGFIASAMMINSLFEGKSIRQVLVDGGYHLIVLLLFGTILGAWTA